MKLIYELKGVATLHSLEEDKVLILKWEKYNVKEEFQTFLDKVYEIFGETKFNKALVDTSETQGLISPENQKWMEEFHFPRLLTQGLCKYVATVVPASTLGQMTNEKWQDNLVKVAGMELLNVPNREKGLDWLRSK
jgi:hypothetical protein